MLFGLLGLIGSGKGTIAHHLEEKYNFATDSFANTLKDVCSVVFGWDRELLEGDTIESRKWRETVDVWWAHELNIPDFTPRFALQYIGTDIFREHFNDAIWLLTLKRRLMKTSDDVVITDARFPNEIKMIQKMGGILIEVARGAEPIWYNSALSANNGDEMSLMDMKFRYSYVHESEWRWIGTKVDHKVRNDSTIEDLFNSIDNIMKLHL